MCWSCMCGVMFCRYTRWSWDHHVRAEYQLPVWSENGTRRLYCSASTILKSLDIYCYVLFFKLTILFKNLFIDFFNVTFLSIHTPLNHIFPIFYFLFKPTFRMLFVGVESSNTQKENRGLFLMNRVVYKMQFSHELFKSRHMNHAKHENSFPSKSRNSYVSLCFRDRGPFFFHS